MNFNGLGADAELRGNFFGAESAAEELKDFEFTIGSRVRLLSKPLGVKRFVMPGAYRFQ